MKDITNCPKCGGVYIVGMGEVISYEPSGNLTFQCSCFERMRGGAKDDTCKLEMSYLGKTATWWVAAKFESYKISAVADMWWFHNEDGLNRALDLIEKHCALSPESYLAAVIAVRKFGAEKYGLLNYRKGMNWSRLFSAFRRHIYYYPLVKFEELDKDSNQPHWAHAACCLMFLMEYATESIGVDDRNLDVVK